MRNEYFLLAENRCTSGGGDIWPHAFSLEPPASHLMYIEL